ncbi:AMP-binding protein [Streptomyces hydrogenans]|uniref:AMP-binding protein n=1 Tax=Streptomyces hydrogenans TaxID=1873719 RepID=UPI0035DFDF54
MTRGSESHRRGEHDVDTVLRRFEHWARNTPDAPAVAAGPESLTYARLDARADRLARRLLVSGLPPGGLVAVGTSRRVPLVVALLGVLKAGGAYVVVDAERPHVGRRQLAAVEPFALLTDAAGRTALDDGAGRTVLPVEEEPARDAVERAVPGSVPDPVIDRSVAARVFTGAAEPRAVVVGHERLLAAFEAWAEVARLTPEDRHLIVSAADVTAFATGWTRALCSGGSLVLPSDAPSGPEEVAAVVGREHVTVLYAGPAVATGLAPVRPDPAGVAEDRRDSRSPLRSLRLVAVSGDRLYLDEQEALRNRLHPGTRVLNVYGTAETAGTGTWFEVPHLPGPLDAPERVSLLGGAFPGCGVALHDGEIRLTPPGGGEAIATGDLGRRREDGLLEFGGRIRHHVVLPDGRTLDPYPVESAIRGHEGVDSVVVTGVDATRGPRRLVAYVAPPDGVPLPDSAALRVHLANRVAAEDVPRTVVRLGALPRNRAGQEDRSALPLPALAGPEGSTAKSGKGGAPHGTGASLFAVLACAAVPIGFVAMLVTDAVWPGSTELDGIPAPWSGLFFLLYVFECLAFGLGLAFLLLARPSMVNRRRRGSRLAGLTHLAISYLLMAWWPQDNLYRLAAKNDWPQQALLVYVFNVPLMIAAAVVALSATKSNTPFEPDPKSKSESESESESG